MLDDDFGGAGLGEPETGRLMDDEGGDDEL